MEAHEFGAIKDEDLLRRLWQETEDFGRKKEIRARMYKLREARLREFYTTDMDTSEFSKTPITSRHGESMADQSFEHLKTKEIRDCASPIRENKFGISLPTDTSGWNINTTAESSADGKSNRVHSYATTDGVRNVQGGQTAFAGRNEQLASDKYEGDDRNYTHSMGDSAKSMLQENTVIGDPNNRFTQNKSTAESSSTYVVKSQKVAPDSGDGSSFTSTSSTEKFETQNVIKKEFVKTSKQSYVIDSSGNRQLVDDGFAPSTPGRFIDNGTNSVQRNNFQDNSSNSTSTSRTVTSNVQKIHEDTLHNITNKTFGLDQDRNRFASASSPDNTSRPASASPYNTNSPATANANSPATANANMPASPHGSGPNRAQPQPAAAHGTFDDNNQQIPTQTHNIPVTTNAGSPQRPDLSREPARVQEAFRLAEQPGTVISRKVEYPNERTVCITETKRLDDGTTVTTKRYETKGSENTPFSNTLRPTNGRPGDKAPYTPVDKDVEFVTNRPKTDNERQESVKKDLGNDKYITEKKYYVDDVNGKPAADLKKPQPAAQQPYMNRKISMEVDAAHDAFARSLRCVSPVDNRGSNKSLRSNSTYDKSRLTKGRRSNSRDTVTSDVSKISTNTVTKHDAPKEYDFMRPTITSEIRSSTKTPERQLPTGKRPSRPIDENEQFLVRERAPELAHEQPDDRSPTGRPKERPSQKSPLQGRPAPGKGAPKPSRPDDVANDDDDDDDLYVEEIDIILEVNDRGEITSPRRSVSPNKPGEVKNRRPTPASPGPRGLSPQKPESRIKKITTTTIEETSPSKYAPGKKPSDYRQPAGKKSGRPEDTDDYPTSSSPRDYSPDAPKSTRRPTDDKITSINLKSTIKSPNGRKPGDDSDGPKPRGTSPDYRYPSKSQPREGSPGKQTPSKRRPQNEYPDQPGTIISRKIVKIDDDTAAITEIIRLLDRTRVTVRRFAPNDGSHKPVREVAPDTHEPYRPNMRKPDEPDSVPDKPGTIVSRKVTIIDETTVSIIEIVRLVDGTRVTIKRFAPNDGTHKEIRETKPDTYEPYESQPEENAPGMKSPTKRQPQDQYPDEPGTIISRKIVVIDDETVTITVIIRLVDKTLVTIRRFAPNDGTHDEILESQPDTYEPYEPSQRKPEEPERMPRQPGTIVSRKITEIDETTISVTEIIILVDRTRVTVRRFAPNDETLDEIDESEPDTYEPYEPTPEDRHPGKLREVSPVTKTPGRFQPSEKSPTRPSDTRKSPSRPGDTRNTPKASSPTRRPEQYPDQPGKIISRKVVVVDEKTVSITEIIRLVDKTRVTIRRFAPNDGTHKEILESRPDTYEPYEPRNRKPVESEGMPRQPGTIVSRTITDIDETTISVTEVIVTVDKTRVTVRRFAPNDDTLDEIDESEPDTYEPYEPEDESPTDRQPGKLRENSPVTKKPGRYQPNDKSPTRPSDTRKTPDQPGRRQPGEKSPSRPGDTRKTPKASSPTRRPDQYPDQPGKIISRKVVVVDDKTVSITEIIRLVDKTRVTIRRFAPNDGTHQEILESRPDTYEPYEPKNRKPTEPEGMPRKPGTIVSRTITEVDETTISVTEVIVTIDKTRVTVRRFAPNDDTLDEIDESEPDTYESYAPAPEDEYPKGRKPGKLREGSPDTKKPGRYQPTEKSPTRPSDTRKTPDQPGRRQPGEKSPSRPSDNKKTPSSPSSHPDQPGKIISRKVVVVDDKTVSITEIIRLVDKTLVTIRRFAPNDGTHRDILESRPDTYEPYEPRNQKPAKPEEMPRLPGTIVSRTITDIDETTISVTEIIVTIDKTRVTVRRFAPNDDTLDEIDESEPDTYESYEPEDDYPTDRQPGNLRERSPVTKKPGRYQPNEKSPTRPSDTRKTPDQPGRRQPGEKSPSRPDQYPDQPGKIISRKVVDVDEKTVSITEVIRLVDKTRVTIRRFAPNDGTHREISETRPDTYEPYEPRKRKPAEPEGMPRQPGTIVSRTITDIDETTISVTEIIVTVDKTRVTVRRFAPNDDTLDEIDESEPDTYESYEPEDEYPTDRQPGKLREGSPDTKKPGRYQPTAKSPTRLSDTKKTPKATSPPKRPNDYPDKPGTIISRKVVVVDESTVSITEIVRLVDKTRVTIRRFAPNDGTHKEISETWPDSYEPYEPSEKTPTEPDRMPQKPGTVISRKITIVDETTISIVEIIRLVDKTRVTVKRFAPNDDTLDEIDESEPDTFEPYEPRKETSPMRRQPGKPSDESPERSYPKTRPGKVTSTSPVRQSGKPSSPDRKQPLKEGPSDQNKPKRPLDGSPDRKSPSKASPTTYGKPRDESPEIKPGRKYPSSSPSKSMPGDEKKSPEDAYPAKKTPRVYPKDESPERKPATSKPGQRYPTGSKPGDESPDDEDEYPLNRQPKKGSPSKTRPDKDYPSGRITSKPRDVSPEGSKKYPTGSRPKDGSRPRDESPEDSEKYPTKSKPGKESPSGYRPRDESPEDERKYPTKSSDRRYPKAGSPDTPRAATGRGGFRPRDESPEAHGKYPTKNEPDSRPKAGKPREESPEAGRRYPTKPGQKDHPEDRSTDRPRGTSKPRDESPEVGEKYPTKPGQRDHPEDGSFDRPRGTSKPRGESPEPGRKYPTKPGQQDHPEDRSTDRPHGSSKPRDESPEPGRKYPTKPGQRDHPEDRSTDRPRGTSKPRDESPEKDGKYPTKSNPEGRKYPTKPGQHDYSEVGSSDRPRGTSRPRDESPEESGKYPTKNKPTGSRPRDSLPRDVSPETGSRYPTKLGQRDHPEVGTVRPREPSSRGGSKPRDESPDQREKYPSKSKPTDSRQGSRPRDESPEAVKKYPTKDEPATDDFPSKYRPTSRQPSKPRDESPEPEAFRLARKPGTVVSRVIKVVDEETVQITEIKRLLDGTRVTTKRYEPNDGTHKEIRESSPSTYEVHESPDEGSPDESQPSQAKPNKKSPQEISRKPGKPRNGSPEPEDQHPREQYPDQPGTIISRRIVKIDQTTISITEIIRLDDGTRVTTKRYAPDDGTHKEIFESEPRTHEPYEPEDEYEEPEHVKEAFRLMKKPGTIISRKIVTIDEKTVSITEIKRLLDGTTVTTKRYEPNDGTHKEIRENSPKDHEPYDGQPGEPTGVFPDEPGTIIYRKIVIIDVTTVSITEIIRTISRIRVTIRRFAPNDGTHQEIRESEPDTYEPYEPKDMDYPEPEHFRKTRRLAQRPGTIISRKIIVIDETIIVVTEVKRLEDGTVVTINRFAPNDKTLKEIREPSPTGTRPKTRSPYVEDDPSPSTSPVPQYDTPRKFRPDEFPRESSPQSGIPTRKPNKEQPDGGRFTKPRSKDDEPETSSCDSSPDYKTKSQPRKPPGFETDQTPVRRSPNDRSEPEESSRDSSPVTKRPAFNKPQVTVTEHSETDEFEEIKTTVKNEKSPVLDTKIPSAIRTSPKRESSPGDKVPTSRQPGKSKTTEESEPSSRDTYPDNRKPTKGKVIPGIETEDYDEPKVSTTTLKMKPVKQTTRPDGREPDRDSSPDAKEPNRYRTVCDDSEFAPAKPRKPTNTDSIGGDSTTEDDDEEYVKETVTTKRTVTKTVDEDEKYFRKPNEKTPDDDKYTPDSPSTTRRETYEERCKRIIGVPEPRDQSPSQPKDTLPKQSEIRERKMLIRRETEEMEKVIQTTIAPDNTDEDDGPTRGSPVKKLTSVDDFLNFEKQAIEAEKIRATRKSPEKLKPVEKTPRSSTPYIEDEEEPFISSRDSSPGGRRSKPSQPLIKTKFVETDEEETKITTKKVISKTVKSEPEKPKTTTPGKSSLRPTQRETSPDSKMPGKVAKTSEAFINLEKKGAKPEPEPKTPTKKTPVTSRKDTAPVHPTCEREKPMQRASSENPMRPKGKPQDQTPSDEYPDQPGTIISRDIVNIDRTTVVITEVIRLTNRTRVTVRRFAPNDRTHKPIRESEPDTYEAYEPKPRKIRPEEMPQKPGTIVSRKISIIDETTISILEVIILVDKTRVTVRRFAPNDDTVDEIDENEPDTYETYEVTPGKGLPNKTADKMPTPSPYKTKPGFEVKPKESSPVKFQPLKEYPDQAGTIISRTITVIDRTTVSITEIIRLINKTRVTIKRFAPNDGTHKEIRESEPDTYEKYNPRNRKPIDTDSLPQKPGTIVSRKITYIDEVTITVTEIYVIERTRVTVRRFAPNDGTLKEIDESEPETYEAYDGKPDKSRPLDKTPKKATKEPSPIRREPSDEYPDQPGTIISRRIVVINIKTVTITEIIRLVNKTRVTVKRTAPNDGTHKEIRESEPDTYEAYEPTKSKPNRRPSQKDGTTKYPSGEKSPIHSEMLENIEIEVEHVKTTKTDEKVKRNSLVSITSTDEYNGKPRYPDLIHEPEDETTKRKPGPKVQNIPIFEEETNDFIGLRIEEVVDSGESEDDKMTRSNVTEKISKFTKKVEEISSTNLRSPKSPRPDSPTRSKFSPTSRITEETHKKTSKTYHSETSETYEEDECLLSVSQKVNRFTNKADKLEPTAPQKSPELVKNAVRKTSKPGYAPDSPTAITKRKLNESVERLEETTTRSRERMSVERETPEETTRKTKPTKDKTYKDRKESASTLLMRSTEAVKRAKEIFENKTSPQKQPSQPKQKDILSRPSVFEEKRKTSRIQSDVSDVESTHEHHRTTERRTSFRKQYISDDNDEVYERSSSRESGHTPSYMRQTIASIEHMKRRTSIDGNQTIVETEQLTINTIPQGKSPNKAPSMDEANIEEIFDLEVLENMLETVVGYEQRRRIRAQIRVVKKIVEDHLSKPSNGKKQPQEPATKAPLRRPSGPDNNTTTKTTRTIRNEGNKIIDEKVKTTERRRLSGQDSEHEIVKTSTIIKKTSNVSPTRKSSDTTPDSPSRRNSRPKADEPSPLKTRPAARYPYTNQKSIDAEKNKQNRPKEPEKPTSKTSRPTQDFIKTEREATRQQTTKSSRSPSPKGSRVSTTSRTVEKTTVTKTPETTRKVVTKDRYVTDATDPKPVWANAKNILKTPSARPEQPRTPTATRKVEPKSYRMPDYNSDDITSSYGIGPTDENGLPMFGLRALKKKTATPTTTSKVSGSIVTESFYSENGATPTGERKTIVYSTDANDLPENLQKNDRTPSEIRDSLIEKSSRGKISSVTKTEKFGRMDTNDDDSQESGPKGSGAKVVRRGSVKKLTEKFTNKTTSVETNSPSGSYPKAGLILRSKSQSSQSSNPDFSRDDGVEFDESDVELRSKVTRRETTTTRYSGSSFQDDDDRPEQSSRSSKTRSFLNDGSKVTGAYDIIDRMRNADNVREAGDTEDDKEARALLNKFLGASILMSGVESSMASSMSSSNEKLPNTSSKSGNKSKVTKRTVKVTRTGGDSTNTETIDFEDIWDEKLLRQLLEASTNIEERRIIRARLNQIMADREACADVIASVTADLHSQHLDSASNVEESTTTEVEEKDADDGSVTTTKRTVTTTRTMSSNAPKKPMSPFAKFQQLEKQNSITSPSNSPKLPSTPTSPMTPSSPGGGQFFKFTDPDLNRKAATVKDQLLQWCQMKTKEYENIQITNFSSCWSDGLAFCALIHHFLPDAFDYSQLTPKQRRHNFDLAFRVADEKAGIAPLLDVEDMVVMRKPDWKCVFTYVQSIYRRFRNED